MCMFTCICMCTCMCMCICICVYIDLYSHTSQPSKAQICFQCIYVYVHVYIHRLSHENTQVMKSTHTTWCRQAHAYRIMSNTSASVISLPEEINAFLISQGSNCPLQSGLNMENTCNAEINVTSAGDQASVHNGCYFFHSRYHACR